ncbi:hypothetical protein LF1_32940 [Rubripirellula obstinata]|uniref:Uncharacterized protein n=2 Tax=Rubripirellula obstinata TaxID=406547 RepID=A0A5B1CN09_9BACT|nr:hypothetical protein [Rubripirellula obstinata]KAA1260753.1 hypothetical protein LF1_32940 [Rubripirellula obstinata]
MKSLLFRFTIAMVMLSTTCAFSQTPVQRQTADRDADLIQALVTEQRFDDAKSVCLWNLNQHQKTSDPYALAITQIAKVNIAKQIASGAFDSATVKTANQPIDQLLSKYPDLDRRLFLEAAKISVRQMAVQMDVAAAAINVSQQDTREQVETLPAMVRLTRLTRDTESLIDRIRQSIPQDDTKLKDQQRLEQELLVATVSMALMQTELFLSDTADAIAAATAAIQAAEQTQLRLPPDSQAAAEVRRMRITAVLRSGDAKLASAELRQLLDQSDQPPSSNLQALQVEILLALGQVKEAGKLLATHFDSSSDKTASSIPMDLARLRYLLADDQTDAAANWITKIGQRHGLYARRLAEAIVLSKLDRSLSDSNATSSPPAALVETRGRQLIREGKLDEGGRMLAAAAGSQSDPKRAIEIAIAAAAALQKAELFQAGSDALSSVAKQHSDSPNAPPLDLQAIMMLTSGSTPASGDQIESRLRQHLETWPESDVSASARSWLIELLVNKQKLIDAAVIATSLTPSQINASSMDAMVSQWESTFRVALDDDLDAKVSRIASDAMTKLNEHPLVVTAHRQLAARFFDRASLHSIPEQDASQLDHEPAWVDQVIQFRRDGKLDPELRSLTEDIEDVRQRLVKDGQRNPTIRKRIADLLASWSSATTKPIDQAVIQLWLGNVAEAVRIVESNLTTNDQAELLIAAATALQDSNDQDAKNAAIRWWDQLAAGSKVGSPNWHRGKIASIDLLDRSGKKEEAARRASYILLTNANLTPEQKAKYQSHRP